MRKQFSSVKLLLTIAFITLGVFGVASFAAHPSFSITPATLTGKLHCNYTFGLILNPGGQSYNAFQSTIRFESGYVLITPGSVNTSVFNNITDSYITSGFLYEAYGTMLPGQSSTATITGLTFGFKTIANITGTQLLLTTRTGGTVTFGKYTTRDGITINSSIDSRDILTGVYNGAYTFVPLPCIPDTNPPIIGWNYPTNGLRFVPMNATITMVMYDRVGAHAGGSDPRMSNNNNTEHYRYSGNDTSNLANYVPVPTSGPRVDNQEGVNSGTIRLTVACPTCSGGVGWSYNFTPASPTLTIVDRTGNLSINMLTRQNKIRGYYLSLPAPAPYEIEKEVTVYRTGVDNPNENGIIHTGHGSFSFNAPQNPTITRIQPSGSTNIPTTFSTFVFRFIDDRAGIDTGTISITIPQYSSGTKFYTGHTYSGSDLTITLISGTYGTGNAGSYLVSFNVLRPFPSNTTIQITGFVKDLAGNVGTYAGSFTTAMSCADYGCADIFTTNILGGLNFGIYPFTGTIIQIIGTALNSPYPYLTGTNGDIVMCGLPYSYASGTILTGNIGIYDTSGTSIKGTAFTGDKLYISGMDGLDFVYQNGIIIIQ